MVEVTAQEWIELAKEDLHAADLLLKQPEPLLRPALFHCQQAAEKALKAGIVEVGETPPKVHLLEILLDRLLRFHPNLLDLREAARVLSPYAIDPRYAREAQDYTEGEARDALSHAKEIVSRVESL